MEVLSSRVLVRPRDQEVSRRFYAETLGLAVAREFPGGTVFFLGTGYLELSKADPAVTVGSDAVWLQVRDLAATEASLRAAGVPVTRERRREPWGLDEMWIADPDGRSLVLVEVPEGHPLRNDRR